MKKILFISDIHPNKSGSFEEFTLFLSRELQRKGHLLYLGFNSEPIPILKSELENEGVRLLNFNYDIHKCGIGNLRSKINDTVSIYRSIKKHKIDIVHFNFFGLTDPKILVAYLTGAKIIFTDHSSGFADYRPRLKWILAKILHFFISLRVSKYIAVSTFVKERLAKTHHAHGDKTITLYNGVNIERFKPRITTETRSDLGLPLDKKIICAVAMLIPEKGLQYLIRAVSLLVSEHSESDVFVVVVGVGPYREELEILVKELQLSEYVRFLGNRSDVHLIISASDVVAVPSIWAEAFGLIISEAMASARPVVASNVGGIPEVVESGKTGILVEPADMNELAKALLEILSNDHLKDKMGEEGRIKAVLKFNLETQAKRLVALYEEIMTDVSSKKY